LTADKKTFHQLLQTLKGKLNQGVKLQPAGFIESSERRAFKFQLFFNKTQP
jgi:hypothetical protein